MKTGNSIFSYLIKNLLYDVGLMGFLNGVYQGLFTIYSEKQEDIVSLRNSMMEEVK